MASGRHNLQPLQPGEAATLVTQGANGEADLEKVGARLGLTGHPTIYIDLPESASAGGLPPRSSSGLATDSQQAHALRTRRHQILLPYLGTRPFLTAVSLLRNLDSETRPRGKIALLQAVRQTLLGTLGTGSFSEMSQDTKRARATATLTAGAGTEEEGQPNGDASGTAVCESAAFDESHRDAASIQQRLLGLSPFAPVDSDAPASSSGALPQGDAPLSGLPTPAIALEEVSAGSVEDYMSSLCFLLLLAAPSLLLSNLHFLRALLPASAGVSKALVDTLVAAKYLMATWDGTIGPALAAREAKRVSKEQAAQAEAAANHAKREAQAKEEQAMAQQARELSKQIQEAEEMERQKAELMQQPPDNVTPLTTATGAVPSDARGLDATAAYQLMLAPAALPTNGHSASSTALDSAANASDAAAAQH